MSLVYASTLKSTRMQAVISAIDAQSAAGTIEIGTDAMAAVLIVIPLSKPSFTMSGSIITMAGAPKSATASATGVASVAQIKDGGGNVVVSGLSVNLSNSDIVINATGISSGDQVTMNSATITHG
jgi:hypothetical protein